MQSVPDFLFSSGETPKIIFHIPRNPYLSKRKQNKEGGRSAWRFFHYYQLPGKILAIFRGEFGFFFFGGTSEYF